jgi:alpha-tubulin suppressor-like RCC1 family protein
LQGGTVKCWGEDDSGQLGDGTTTDSNVTVNTAGVTNAMSVAGSSTHSCALLQDGTIACWGWNYRGALGDGTQTQRLTPVRVLGF